MTTKCKNLHTTPSGMTVACLRLTGHTGPHKYVGITWPNEPANPALPTNYTLVPYNPYKPREVKDGTEHVLLIRADRPETPIGHLHVTAGDVDFLNKLFRATAERAWNEGFEAAGDSDLRKNPYEVKEEGS